MGSIDGVVPPNPVSLVSPKLHVKISTWIGTVNELIIIKSSVNRVCACGLLGEVRVGGLNSLLGADLR